ACPKLSTRLGYHVAPYLVLVWMLVDLPGVTMVRIRHYSFLIDLMCFVRSQCAINPMTSNIRSRTSLCAMSCAKSLILWLLLADSDRSKMVIEPEVSNLAPAPNVDVISW
ncbi:hypothetical protein BS47DRAFT_1343635, partial [Hydnum rufescens UP504]